MTLKYVTITQFAEALGIISEVPTWESGSTPSNEEVGIGDNLNSIFYLDQKNIIDGTYILYYGSSSSTTNELTETTEYSIDIDTGKITLTSAGITKLGTNTIFAKYKYLNNEMSNSYLTSILERAESEVDSSVNSTFTDGTLDNPSYPSVIEIQESPGYFLNRILVKNKPLIDISSNIDGDIDDSQVTIDLSSGDGVKFPTSGYLIIDSEVISYTGISTDTLTGVTRGVLGTTAASHDDASDVHSTIVFTSGTNEGNDVAFSIKRWNSEVYISDDGLSYLFEKSDMDRMVAQDVANRIKIIYYYGYNTIPAEITRLTIIFAKRQLMQDNISKAMIAGRNEFKPQMFNADRDEINMIVNDYIIIPMANV